MLIEFSSECMSRLDDPIKAMRAVLRAARISDEPRVSRSRILPGSGRGIVRFSFQAGMPAADYDRIISETFNLDAGAFVRTARAVYDGREEFWAMTEIEKE